MDNTVSDLSKNEIRPIKNGALAISLGSGGGTATERLEQPDTAGVTPDPDFVPRTAIYKVAGTYYYDADGNLTKTETTSSVEVTENNLSDLDADALEIENQKSVELPSTGGIGTTIFYIVGAILVIGAGVVLVTRRRMDVQ